STPDGSNPHETPRGLRPRIGGSVPESNRSIFDLWRTITRTATTAAMTVRSRRCASSRKRRRTRKGYASAAPIDPTETLRRTATRPLAASSTKTRIPQRAPRTRYALVAPTFRLPVVRKSMPRARPIQSPDGRPPRRNPIRMEVTRSGIGVSALRRGKARLLAPLPVEHDRNPLEAETLPQTTLQVTYIILDPISR